MADNSGKATPIDMEGIKAQILENAKIVYPFLVTHRLTPPNACIDDTYLRAPNFSIITMSRESPKARVIFDDRSASSYPKKSCKVTFLEGSSAASTGEALEKLLKLTEELVEHMEENIFVKPRVFREVFGANGSYFCAD